MKCPSCNSNLAQLFTSYYCPTCENSTKAVNQIKPVNPSPIATYQPGFAFDFGEGKGKVPAHQHSNGGGWVANTATVATTALIGPNAKVYDFA